MISLVNSLMMWSRVNGVTPLQMAATRANRPDTVDLEVQKFKNCLVCLGDYS